MRHCLFNSIICFAILWFGCVYSTYAGDNNSSKYARHISQNFLTSFVTACKVTKVPREAKYASDLNTLKGIRTGTILAYVFDIGSDGPPFQKIGHEKIYYNTFNLYIIDETNLSSKPYVKYRTGNSVSNIYMSSRGRLFEIEWRASVTFNDENGRGGYLEGQGGLLSTAEYEDMISYLQTQPFRMIKEWKSILSDVDRLPVCEIEWAATDRYMSSQNR